MPIDHENSIDSSLPADAQIVHLKLERLPFLPSRLLRRELENRLSPYGQVLDLGLTLSGKYYTKRAYATLNLTPVQPDDLPYEPLQRVITWIEDNGRERDIYLQWDEMPDFCRNCQAADHCRADCPTKGSSLKCYNCNENGHISRQCPRNNSMTPITSNKKRAVVVPPIKTRKVADGTNIQSTDSSTKPTNSPVATEDKQTVEPQEIQHSVMEYIMAEVEQQTQEDGLLTINQIENPNKKVRLDTSKDISTFRHLESRIGQNGQIITVDHSLNQTYITTLNEKGQRITYNEMRQVVDLDELYPVIETASNAGLQ